VKVINIQAAKTHLSRIVDDVVDGEEVVLAKAGRPLVRLVPYVKSRSPREPGILAGQAWEAADCWTPGDSGLEASIESPLIEGLVAEPPASSNP
jgi:prevent-host-death family protein